MLEFIVLGQIPGTDIQITFAWFAVALLCGLIWADMKLHKTGTDKKISQKTNKSPA